MMMASGSRDNTGGRVGASGGFADEPSSRTPPSSTAGFASSGGFTSSSYSSGYAAGSGFTGATGGYTSSTRAGQVGAGSGPGSGYTADAGYGTGLGGGRDPNVNSYGVGSGSYSGYAAGESTLAEVDPASQPAAQPWQPKHSFGRYPIAILNIMMTLNLLSEILKVAINADAAGEYFGWACFNLVCSCFLMLQRVYDQLYLVFKASSQNKDGRFSVLASRPLCSCMCFPFTVAFLPLTLLGNALYGSAVRHFHDSALETVDLEIFAQRPLSTMLISLPLYGLVAHFVMDEELLLHPVMVHMRTVHNLLQTMLEDVPCFIVDALVLHANKDENGNFKWEDITWFGVSLAYSALHALAVAVTTAKEVHDHEFHHTHPVEGHSSTVVGKAARV